MKTAIVTGGTRGIGHAASLALAQQGYRVAAVHHGHAAPPDQLAGFSGIRVYDWDVADYDACAAGIRKIEEELGPVQVLVNNAGITRDSTLHKMTAEQWWDVLHVNLGSMFNMSRHVIEGMRSRNYGRIINISSVNGQKGQFGQANYAAAKAGILGFTRALALESAKKNITVNAIAPGYCATDMVAAMNDEALAPILAQIPAGRLGTAEEIAHLIGFLASEQASYINGATIAINGGLYMS
jgi:acetoacetyl-CoA reductase